MSRNLFDVSGRVALVTGSSSGLGRAIAQGFAEAGATVIINGRDTSRIEAFVGELRASGFSAHGAPFDVTAEHDVTSSIERIEADVGPIEVLVNNAGIQRRAPLLDMPMETWDEVLRNNLTSVFLVGRSVARGMIGRQRGKIINIASLMSEVARKTIAPYTASKGGVRQLTRAMCVEWAEHNIQVNAIGPGYFHTEMNATLSADPAFDGWVRGRTPAGRWGEPEELIGAALFLASPASDFVNGQTIYVDGGLLAGI